MTDYKQLCEELADNLHRYQCWYIEDNGCSLHELEALLRRADAALAEPEPEGPTRPIPVSERLPGDQLCWWYEPDEEDGYGGMWTLLRIRGGTTRYSHWLPADALSQPS